ncbi:phosphodiester glycosidase family protein [Aureispira sp. CCB-QB1]|uniref:phosphodiester glycosidase family protein n=1 Tax=Aureispira sp. CCB-QB1 TaxID=1313421 RepID=UPI00069855B9|nr:phosphodiester glycosidase family protein [Aureispira sp. CCB-QB1]
MIKTILSILFLWIIYWFASIPSCTKYYLLEHQESSILRDTMIKWRGKNYVVLSTSPEKLSFFLGDKSNRFKSFSNLASHLKNKNKQLLFAMNGGMYLPNHNNEPQGLYIETGKIIKELDSIVAYRPIKTNFYLHPNGVFYITKDGSAYIKSNKEFQQEFRGDRINRIKYATQSGPLLVNHKELHKAFTPKSKNVHIRNAVGILPSGEVCFVISEDKICFHDIASLFKDNLKCRNALYLDGFVSELYYPKIKKYNSLNRGDFGVIIGIID